jgi:hypothetical protein
VKGRSHSEKVAVVWVFVFVLCGIGALYFLAIFRWHAQRPAPGGDAPSTPVLSLALDYLFAVWLVLPILLCIVLVFAGIEAWRAFLESRKTPVSRARRAAIAFSGIFAALGALLIFGMTLPAALAAGARSTMCRTTTYERSVSPNGRYQAAVIQVDCGAMSNFNRQVILTRIPFVWASQSIMFFNEEPTLHLSWRGRMLTIEGPQSPQNLAHPPPDPMVWGGVMARYVGSEGGGSAK